MEFRPRKRNTPIATLLRNYENKQSKMVVESRKEIQWRFESLDWKDQKKILYAFLASGKSDREWAARQLTSFWDKSFEPIIKKMWEETREEILEWPIIRYFPIDYLKSNIDRLGTGRSYYFLCLRLINEEDFEIDESRLRETDLLNLYCNSSRILSKEKALDTLFAMVYKLCTGKYSYKMNSLWVDEADRGYMVSILENGVMRDALHSLEHLNMNDVVAEFIAWHMVVCEDLLNSDEFDKLYAGCIDRYDYNCRRLILTKKYYYEHLDSKYKQADENPYFGLDFYPICKNDGFVVELESLFEFEVDETELGRYDKMRERALDKLKKDARIAYNYVDVRMIPKEEPLNLNESIKVLAEMSEKNPAVSKLIDNLGLSVPSI